MRTNDDEWNELGNVLAIIEYENRARGDDLANVLERSSILLDSCSQETLSRLALRFEPEVLGGYYPWGEEFAKLDDSELSSAYDRGDPATFSLACERLNIVDSLVGLPRKLYMEGRGRRREHASEENLLLEARVRRAQEVEEDDYEDRSLTAHEELGNLPK